MLVTIGDTLYWQALEMADAGMEKPADILREAMKI